MIFMDDTASFLHAIPPAPLYFHLDLSPVPALVSQTIDLSHNHVPCPCPTGSLEYHNTHVATMSVSQGQCLVRMFHCVFLLLNVYSQACKRVSQDLFRGVGHACMLLLSAYHPSRAPQGSV